MTAIDRTDMLGLVELTEQRIIAAIDSLGSDDPEAAALDLAKALASLRAIKGEVEQMVDDGEGSAPEVVS